MTLRTHKPLTRKTPMPRGTTRVRQVSSKRATYHASAAGKDGLEYIKRVKEMPCRICGSPPPNDAHHCQDRPLDGEHIYQQVPCAGRKSGAFDTISLCRLCHLDGPEAYHRDKTSWRERNGPDYGFIPATRATLSDMEIDF